MKKQRIFAVILVVVMLVCALPLSLFAEAEGEQATAAQGESTLSLSGVSVSLGSKIALNLFVDADDAVIEDTTAKISVDAKTSEIKLSDADKTESGVKISVLLSSTQLSKDVKVSFIDKEGNVLDFATSEAGSVTEYSTSVMQYSKRIVNDASFDAKAKNAVKAMMAFGAYAEKYFNGTEPSASEVLTADELANVVAADFGTVIKSDGTVETLIDESLNETIVATGDTSNLGKVCLVLDSYNKIRIDVSSDAKPEVSSSNATVEVFSKGNNLYSVDITKIQARDLNTVYTVKIGDATVSLSLLAVAKLVADAPYAYGEDFVNLAKALYNYYHYTHSYETPRYFVYEDFSKSVIDLDDTSEQVVINNITYSIKDQTGVSLKTVTDGGESYLLVTKSGSGDPIFRVQNPTTGTIADMKSNQISYEFSFSADGTNKFLGIDNIYLSSSKGDPKLLKIYSDKDVVYYGTEAYSSSNSLGFVSSDIFTVRLVIDFESELVKFYNDGGELIMERALAKKSAANGLALKAALTENLFSLRADADSLSGSIRIYGLKIAEGNIFENSNSIVYDLDGGTLPEKAPMTYSQEEETFLPTPTHPTNDFVGWFTSASFDPATKITSISPQTRGKVTVYAKWIKYLINEDFSGLNIDMDENSENVTANNILFAFSGKTGASLKTGTDAATGKSYVVLTRTNNDGRPVLRIDPGSSVQSIADVSSNQISYEISFGADGTNSLVGIDELYIGSSGGGAYNLLKTWGSDGSVAYYGNKSSGDVVAHIDKTGGAITTVRMVIDFENENIKFYAADGEVIKEWSLPVPSLVESGLDWKATMTNELLYIRINSPNWFGSVRIYGIKIAEGNIFG